VVAGVNLHPAAGRATPGRRSLRLPREYGAFLFRALWAATRAHRRRRYALVEVHSLPDYLVFAALPLSLQASRFCWISTRPCRSSFAAGSKRQPTDQLQTAAAPGETVHPFANEVMTVNEPLAERLRGFGVKSDR